MESGPDRSLQDFFCRLGRAGRCRTFFCRSQPGRVVVGSFFAGPGRKIFQNIVAGRKAPAFAFSTNLNDVDCDKFMKNVIDIFYHMNDDIFIATTKITIG